MDRLSCRPPLCWLCLFGVWPRNLIGPSVILIGFGLAGLALTATPAVAWAPLVAGVFSGSTLLAGSLSIPLRELALF